MSRSSTTGLPFLVRRTDPGKFCYHREVSAAVAIGDLPVGRITKPLLAEFMDLLQRCPRNVPHADPSRLPRGRIAWGEKPASLGVPRLARGMVNAKGLGSIAAALTVAEKPGHIAANPCTRMGLRSPRRTWSGASRTACATSRGWRNSDSC